MRETDAKYVLVQATIGGAGFIPLSEEEFAALEVARDLTTGVVAFEEKFDIVISNLLELEKTLNDLAAEHMVRSDYEYHSLHDDRVLINQRVQNLLGACRLYLDHGAHHAGQMESAIPDLQTQFKKATNDQYDASAAYRIAEALRNHSQHRGFPIVSFSTGGRRLDREDGSMVLLYRIELRVDVEAMRNDGKTKATVIAEIDQLGAKADLRPVLREYVEGLAAIHMQMRKTLATSVNESESLIGRTIDRYAEAFPTKGSTVGLAAVERNERGNWIRQLHFSPKLIERRQHLDRRNDNFVNLATRHVSSEPPEPR